MLEKSVYYFRMSTTKQADSESTIAHYISRGKKAGFEDSQIYYDVGSGGDRSRENYQRILEMARLRQIDAIYLPNDLSRLMRDVREFKDVQKLLLESKVKLLDLNGNEYKFELPSDILKSDIEMSFAEFERNRNKAKAIDGHAYLRENTIPIRAIFPYKKLDGKLVPNHDLYGDSQASCWSVANELVDKFISSQNIQHTITSLTKKYGLLSLKTPHLKFPYTSHGFRKWLQKHELRGNIHYKKYDEIHYNTHESLITKDKAEIIDRALLINRQGKKKSDRLMNLWKGLMFCGECGFPMRVYKCGKYKYIVCNLATPKNESLIRRMKSGEESRRCNSKGSFGMSPEKLENITTQALIDNSKYVAASSITEPVVTVPTEVKKLQEIIAKYESLAKDDSDMLPLLNKKRQQLRDLLANNEPISEASLIEQRQKFAELASNPNYWRSLSRQEKLLEFNKYIEKITLVKGIPIFKFRDAYLIKEHYTLDHKCFLWHLDETEARQKLLKDYQKVKALMSEVGVDYILLAAEDKDEDDKFLEQYYLHQIYDQEIELLDSIYNR